MRALTLLVFCLPLSACTSTPVPIGAERCWSISSGDKVEGTAILYIPPPLSFHQGPEVSGLNCPGYSIQLVGDAANKAYNEISLSSAGVSFGGPSERIVTLSGNVVRGEREGRRRFVIRVTQLRLATRAGDRQRNSYRAGATR